MAHQPLAIAVHCSKHRVSCAISALYAGNAPVAVHLGLQSNGHFCAWVPTLDPTYSQYSPGLLIHLEIAKAAKENGYRHTDLDRGLNPLKPSLGSDHVKLAIGAVHQSRFVGPIAVLPHCLWQYVPKSRLKRFSPRSHCMAANTTRSQSIFLARFVFLPLEHIPLPNRGLSI